MKEEEIKLTLPMPPSVNGLFISFVDKKTGKLKRAKSKEYKSFEELCDVYKLKNKKYNYIPTKKGLIASYQFFSSWHTKSKELRKKDLSNYFKAMEDKLELYVKGFDDRYIVEYENIKKIESSREEVEIIIKEL